VTDAVVRRDDLHELRFDEAPSRPLDDGEARLRVDRFAFTANNVTYAVFGEVMRYWDFFPAAEPGWGRIPVWGFADVVESRAAGVAEGTRVYGYLPMSTELVVIPARVDERGFVDASAHRRPMASAYNSYRAVGADPVYDAGHEDALMLLRPLLYTAFLLDDFVEDNGRFGASTVVLSSASSKTSAGTAFFLSERSGLSVVGLTSPANATFVESLGVYDRVVAYGDVTSLDRTAGPVVFIDVAGDAAVASAVHHHFGDGLVHSAAVGGTHWDAPRPDAGAGGPLPGAAPSGFFAPDQIRKRADEWGAAKLEDVFAAAWHRALAWADGWLDVRRSSGVDGVRAAYLEVLDGAASPSVGHVLSLHD
jgi:hypothetical protein